jgi:hypothetical protein
MTKINPTTGYQFFIGANARVQEHLDRIEQQATRLRDWAARGMKFCRDELAKDLGGGFETDHL